MDVNIGDEIYTMSLEKYKKITFDLKLKILLIVLLFAFSILFIFSLFMFEERSSLIFIILIAMFFTNYIIIIELSKTPSQRFTIYKSGFRPPTRPLNYLLRYKDYIIQYDQIHDIATDAVGTVITLQLKDGKKVSINVFEHGDIEGHKILIKELSKIKPELHDISYFLLEKVYAAKNIEEVREVLSLITRKDDGNKIKR